MSSKYDKIGNYNLSYELLKDAVREFDGYILGLSQNDIWLFSDKFERPKTDKIDAGLKTFLTELAPRILDRTTGTFREVWFSDNTNPEVFIGKCKKVDPKF